MCSFDFLPKNRKVLTVVAVLILVGISIALLTWTVGKNAVRQSHGTESENLLEDTENDITEPSVEPQTEPTEEPEQVLTEEYELLYEGISVFNSGTAGTYFRYEDIYADLYMRRLQDDTGEYIELSLWSDQKEIWHTINSDDIEDCPLFWLEDSGHLTLDQRLCYYVVEVDGTVYLMRYCMETASNAVTMSYKVFGISTINSPYSFLGSEVPFDADSISLYLVSDSVIDPVASFPIEQMTDFADTVKGYMENGHLAVSTLHGVFEVGTSADGDNPVSPYLYDIFPWIPELVTQQGIHTEGIHSPKELLTVLQNALPTTDLVIMPDVETGGNYFITGNYYSDSDESYLTVRMKEDGSYGGTLLIDNALNVDFTGYYDNGILIATEIMDDPDQLPCEMEISFMNGKATVTITAASEWNIVKVGDTFTLDRNEKPEELEYLRNVENYPVLE